MPLTILFSSLKSIRRIPLQSQKILAITFFFVDWQTKLLLGFILKVYSFICQWQWFSTWSSVQLHILSKKVEHTQQKGVLKDAENNGIRKFGRNTSSSIRITFSSVIISTNHPGLASTLRDSLNVLLVLSLQNIEGKFARICLLKFL